MLYILDFYTRGLFTDTQMAKYVKVGMITKEQYDLVKKTEETTTAVDK